MPTEALSKLRVVGLENVSSPFSFLFSALVYKKQRVYLRNSWDSLDIVYGKHFHIFLQTVGNALKEPC